MATFIDGPNFEFAVRLLEERKKLGINQGELAEKVGIDRRTISMYENGHMVPRDKKIKKLAEVFGICPEWLATGVDKEVREHLEKSNKSSRERAGYNPQVELLYIEDWDGLQPDFIPPGRLHYSPNPTYAGQSSDLDKFIPVVKPTSNRYRAVRFPGSYPQMDGYPSGIVIVFDASEKAIADIKDGSDVIFRLSGKESKPALRKMSREPGIEGSDRLLSMVTGAGNSPIAADNLTVEIFGVVVSKHFYFS